MIVNIEEYLQRIDASFKEKSQKDIYMTYIMIFALIFAFSYLLFWDSSEAELKRQTALITAIESKINNDNLYLQQNPPMKITQLEKEIKDTEDAILLYKDYNEYIKNKIETISSLIYDEVKWGEYLHSISKNAQKYNIKIITFENKLALNNSSFGHVLDISINSSGEYKNTLSFINSLEQSDLVVDLHDMNIKADDELYSDFNISVWGITY